MCEASYFHERDLHIRLRLSLDSSADQSSTNTWLMALQSGIRSGSEHRLSSTRPAKRQARSPLSLLEPTVPRGIIRSVPMRKKCVSVTQLQGRASYFRQPGLKTETHGTSENGKGQSKSLNHHACVYVHC